MYTYRRGYIIALCNGLNDAAGRLLLLWGKMAQIFRSMQYMLLNDTAGRLLLLWGKMAQIFRSMQYMLLNDQKQVRYSSGFTPCFKVDRVYVHRLDEFDVKHNKDRCFEIRVKMRVNNNIIVLSLSCQTRIYDCHVCPLGNSTEGASSQESLPRQGRGYFLRLVQDHTVVLHGVSRDDRKGYVSRYGRCNLNFRKRNTATKEFKRGNGVSL